MKHAVFVLVFLVSVAGGVRAEEVPATAAPDLSGIEVLDLETAQRIALQKNPSISAAAAKVEQARARVSQAMATWWPSLDVSAGGSHVRTSASSLYSFQPSGMTYDEYRAGIQVSWVLFDGFYRSFTQKAARFGEKTAAAAHTDALRLLADSVAQVFLNAQLAQTRVSIAQADLDFYNRQLRDADNRYKVGTGAWGDVLNIKVQINSAKTSLMLSGREYEAAGYGLAALLGIPDAVFPKQVALASLDREFDTGGDEGRADLLIEEALQQRPDVRRVEMQLQGAGAAAGSARASFYPKLLLAGGVNGTCFGDAGLGIDDFGNSVSLNLSWNLFSGGADRARLFEAEQQQHEAGYALADLRNQVAAEVRQDIALLAAAREQVRLQRDTVKLVEENRDLAKNEYEAGEASLVRLNEAQRDLTTTYSRLAQSLVAFHQARQNLLAATGRNLRLFQDKSMTEKKD